MGEKWPEIGQLAAGKLLAPVCSPRYHTSQVACSLSPDRQFGRQLAHSPLVCSSVGFERHEGGSAHKSLFTLCFLLIWQPAISAAHVHLSSWRPKGAKAAQPASASASASESTARKPPVDRLPSRPPSAKQRASKSKSSPVGAGWPMSRAQVGTQLACWLASRPTGGGAHSAVCALANVPQQSELTFAAGLANSLARPANSEEATLHAACRLESPLWLPIRR